MSRQLAIVLVFPGLLGTYGDSGNAVVLRERARDRGIDAIVVSPERAADVPEYGDIYVLGGGEDGNQRTAANELLHATGLRRALARGTPTLAVCAGLQLLGAWYSGPDGDRCSGLGVIDCTSSRARHRHVGEVLAQPAIAGLRQPLVGFENHQGETHLGPGARPLGTIAPANRRERPREEGAVDGGVIGTYLHGPVLALNAELADLLLARVLGPLTPLVDTTVHQARRTRLDGGRRRR